MLPLVAVGEAWGEWEESGADAFLGVSGVCFFDMLAGAGICVKSPHDRDCIADFWHFWRMNVVEPRPMKRLWAAHPEIVRLNVFNAHPPNNRLEHFFTDRANGVTTLPPHRVGKPPKLGWVRPEYLYHHSRLLRTLSILKPNVVVCLGGTATWALLGDPSITKIRGTPSTATTLENLKCLPTFHPAAVVRQWELRPTVVMDFAKAARENQFPDIRRPARHIYIPETINDFYTLQKDQTFGNHIAIDIETNGDQITCVGFGLSADRAIVIPIWDWRRPDLHYWQTFAEERLAVQTIKYFCGRPEPKVLHNASFDLNRLWTTYGIEVKNVTDDTMLGWHALYIESRKSLDYLGSIMTNEVAWKLMRTGKKGEQTLKKDN